MRLTSYLQPLHKFFSYRRVVLVYEPEVFILIVPDRPADAEFLEHGMDVVEPANRVRKGRLVDHAILAAVERDIHLVSVLDRDREHLLENDRAGILRIDKISGDRVYASLLDPVPDDAEFGSRLRVTGVEILRHILDPVGILMREHKRRVAVEVVDDLVVIGRVEIWYVCDAVVANAADQDVGIRRDAADCLDRAACDLVPDVAHSRVDNFIEQLERGDIRVLAVAARELLPQMDEAVLQLAAEEEGVRIRHGLLVEHVALRLMYVENDVQTALPTPGDAVVDERETVFNKRVVLVHDDVVVDRQANMVEPPARDLFNILFRDECVKMLFAAVDALGDPSAQIDAPLKSFESSHV